MRWCMPRITSRLSLLQQGLSFTMRQLPRLIHLTIPPFVISTDRLFTSNHLTLSTHGLTAALQICGSNVIKVGLTCNSGNYETPSRRDLLRQPGLASFLADKLNSHYDLTNAFHSGCTGHSTGRINPIYGIKVQTKKNAPPRSASNKKNEIIISF